MKKSMRSDAVKKFMNRAISGTGKRCGARRKDRGRHGNLSKSGGFRTYKEDKQ